MTGLGKRQKEVLRLLAVNGVWSFHGLGGWNYNGSAHETQQVLDSLQLRGLVQCKGHALGTYFLTPEGWQSVLDFTESESHLRVNMCSNAIACLAIVLLMDALPSDEKKRLDALCAEGKRLAARYSHLKPPKGATYRNLLPNFGLMRRSATYTDAEIVDSVAAGLELLGEPWRFSQMAAFIRDLHRIARKRRR